MCDHCENFKSKCEKYSELVEQIIDLQKTLKDFGIKEIYPGWYFKPKVEFDTKKMEWVKRECKTCNHGSWNNPTKACCIKTCTKSSLWEPVEKKVPTCEACRYFSKIFQLCSTDRGVVDTYLARNDENFCGPSRRWYEPVFRMAERRGIKMSIASMDDLEKKVTALAEFLQVEFKGFAAIKKEEKPKEIHDCKKCKNFPDNQPAGGAYAYCRYLVECLEKDNRFEPKEIVTKCQKCRYFAVTKAAGSNTNVEVKRGG